MKKRTKYACVVVIVPLVLFATLDYVHRLEAAVGEPGADTLLLLLPDGLDATTPAVQEWLDAANEEGLHLQPIHDSEFLNPLSTVHAVGVVLPDQIHRSRTTCSSES